LMDESGTEWCKENAEVIVNWMEEEANKRNLPFLRLAGKALVMLAIRNAKKKERVLRQC